MAYRAPGECEEPIDGEAAAIEELGRRARALRHAVHVPVLLGGIVLGVVAYIVLRALILAHLGAHVPWITGLLTVAPVFILAFRLAPRLGDALAARALPRWRAEVARRYGLDEVTLAETTQFL
jgi:hypothetical protein